MRRTLDLAHERCLCGELLSVHRGRHNESIPCAELAALRALQLAAASCTTAATAMSVIAHAQLHRAPVAR